MAAKIMHNRLLRMSELGSSSTHFMADPHYDRYKLSVSRLAQGEFACAVIVYVAPLLLRSMVRHKHA